MKTIEIEVTSEDIENGVPGDACRCPIALAVERQIGCTVQSVGQGKIYLRRHSSFGVNYSVEGYNLPAKAARFVQWFDTALIGRYLVKPFKFAAKESRWFHHDY